MKHLFKAKKFGVNEYEGVWFDSKYYSKEDAEKQFVPFVGTNRRGFDYTAYKYDGQKYYSYKYLGEFKDNEIPHNDSELWKIKFK